MLDGIRRSRAAFYSDSAGRNLAARKATMKHFNLWFTAVILTSMMAVGAQAPPSSPPVLTWNPADGATVHQRAGMVAVQMAVSDAGGLQSTTLSCTSNDGSSSSVSSFYPGYKAAVVTLHVHVLIFPKMMAFPVPFDGASGSSLFTAPDMNAITVSGTATGTDKQKTAQSVTI